MKKLLFSAFMCIGAIVYSQTQVAYTSFEEPTTGTQYIDTGNANVAHDLINNTGEAP